MTLESPAFLRQAPPTGQAPPDEEPGTSSPSPPAAAAFSRVLHHLGNEIDRGEALVDASLGGAGRKLDPGELIALQAGIYRYSEVVDLAAKLVDRASGALRTVIETSSR